MGCTTEESGFDFRYGQEFFLHDVRPGSGAHPTMVTGRGFPGGKVAGALSCLFTHTWSVHFAGLIGVQNILSTDTGITRKTEGHSFGDHLINGSISVTPSSMIEASIVVCSVSIWLVWFNVQSAYALNTCCNSTASYVLVAWCLIKVRKKCNFPADLP
jgi:hypothetical protein